MESTYEAEKKAIDGRLQELETQRTELEADLAGLQEAQQTQQKLVESLTESNSKLQQIVSTLQTDVATAEAEQKVCRENLSRSDLLMEEYRRLLAACKEETGWKEADHP